jgi:ribosomal protein L37E
MRPLLLLMVVCAQVGLMTAWIIGPWWASCPASILLGCVIGSAGRHLADRESITCPRCGMTSYNPDDIDEGYCGNCHDWTSKPREESS